MENDVEKGTERNFPGESQAVRYGAADTNDRIVFNFRDINHTMRALYEGRESQKRILIILLGTGAITQRKLTGRLGIQPGSASEVLAKLEKSGLILRTESPDDRRTTDIVLTDQGRKLAEEAARQRKERHEEMFSCLTEDEKSQLLTLLEKVNDDWRERYRQETDGCKRCRCGHGKGHEPDHNHGREHGHRHEREDFHKQEERR